MGGRLATTSYFAWLSVGHESVEEVTVSQSQDSDSNSRQFKSSVSESSDLSDLEDAVNDIELTASLYVSLSQMDKTQVLQLLEQSQNIESASRHRSYHTVLFERIADINPHLALRHALDFRDQHRRVELLETVFHEWSLSNLSAAVAAGSKLALPFRRVALQTILRATNLSETTQQEIGLRFGDKEFVSRVIAEERTWSRKQNPEEAWYEAIGDGKRLTRKIGLLVDIAEDWWKRDSDGVLEKIVESTEPGSDSWDSDTYVVLRMIGNFYQHDFLTMAESV